MKRQEYEQPHHQLPHTQASQVRFLVNCPIAHVGYGIEFLIPDSGYRPEDQTITVWDFTEINKWTGPQQTTDILSILKIEGVLNAQFNPGTTIDTSIKVPVTNRNVGQITEEIHPSNTSHSNRTVVAGLVKDRDLKTRLLGFLGRTIKRVRLVNHEMTVQENFHWVQVSLHKPNIMYNGALGNLVVSPTDLPNNYRQRLRILNEVRPNPMRT